MKFSGAIAVCFGIYIYLCPVPDVRYCSFQRHYGKRACGIRKCRVTCLRPTIAFRQLIRLLFFEKIQS